MAEKNEIEVLLDGKVYTVSGCESAEYMQRIANYINAKERELKEKAGYNRQSDAMKSYLMYLNIADDYFKEKEENERLRLELEKKDKYIYEVKREAATLQTQLAHIKNGENQVQSADETRTTRGGYRDEREHEHRQQDKSERK